MNAPFAPASRLRLVLACAFALACLITPAASRAAETLPPPPRDHFNDYAGLVRRETAAQLNRELAQFERDTSNQVVVAIFPRLPSDSSVEDFTVRTAQSWRVGGKARDNGAVLFVFRDSRDIRIETGYGLEGALPDALLKRIIEDEIIPRFRAGDFDAGLTAGVHALMAAARGEYRGTGRTAADARTRGGSSSGGLGFLFLIIVIFLSGLRSARRRPTVFNRHGRRNIWLGPGGWGGGGGGFGGGGSFSGGGGSFGGGGAGGRW